MTMSTFESLMGMTGNVVLLAVWLRLGWAYQQLGAQEKDRLIRLLLHGGR